MANLCSFELHARAKVLKEDVLTEMKRKFGVDPERNPQEMFGVLDTHLDEYKLVGDFYVMQIWGECKWSVASSFYEELNKWAEQNGVDIEIYSEENGVGFQEHFKWVNGRIVDQRCRDMLEFHVDDIMDDEDGELDYLFENKLCKEACCTKDNYQSFADDDGYIRFGGFKEWNFEF